MLAGIAFRSTALWPRPTVPLTLISAVVCRRLPFTSTSTWSAPRPRNVAGRTASVPSAIADRGKFTLGASAWIICAVSVRPVAFMSTALNTSTGTGDLVTVRSSARVPITATASRLVALRCSTTSRVSVWPAAIVIGCVALANPICRNRNVYVPGRNAMA